MKLINENYEGLDVSTEYPINSYYFEYDVKKEDFFLKMNNFWSLVESEVYWYTLTIGKYEVTLPSNLFIMIADVYSPNVDWVKVDELQNRQLSTALYGSDLVPDKWTIEDITVKSVEPATGNVHLPQTKNLLPVIVGDDRMALVSFKDSYVKTKTMNFTCLY